MTRCALMLLLAATSAHAQWNLMPMPASIQPGQGSLAIGPTFHAAVQGAADPRVTRALERVTQRIAQLTGTPLRPGAPTTLSLRIDGTGAAVQSLAEDESYRLTVTPRQAVIAAANPLGAMHGLETFYQLIAKSFDGFSVPAVTIEDHPRFAWRGLMIDVSRHFMPLDVIRRNLDGMAAVKLNVFHWHLSDDQGFRVESKRFPKLQQEASDGLFYTQDEIRGVIAYARDRGIRVVPEFDMPGHTMSWLVAYPELASAPGPYQIGRQWGVFDPVMDPARPELYTFLDAFIGEMTALFPDAYFHIGGDEVNGKQWAANTTDVPEFMRSHGFKTQHDLQAFFNQQVEKIVTKYGRRMEGWDEILNPALPKDIVIQSWRGAKSLADAAHQGYFGILSSGYYLDHIEPSSKLYLVDPLSNQADALTKPEQARILGGEVCMWAEYVSPETVDSRIWPRSAAIAERFWSPAGVRDVPDMYRRLAAVDPELDLLGLRHNANYQSMLERLAGSGSPADFKALKTLADVLDPGALGLRHRVNPGYTQSTPLNRLVDAARPDPALARHFSQLTDRYLANTKDVAARDEIVQWLKLWAAGDAALQPLIAQREILRDVAPVSAMLAKIAALALEGKPGPELQTAQKPVGEVTIAVAPAIAKLVASGARF
ncbi:MAG: family 20 glycosylhydrolase [Acidobacteriota bacterium]|nr:family 20 glycosylhydrolase [Acidobacteriota bacterium]